MDVKVGSGAFMASEERAKKLVGSIIATANNAGLKTHALITDMNEVLGLCVGNALEIAESVRYLRNEMREPRLDDVVLSLCAEMVLIGGIESTRDAARARCEVAISSGHAAEIFGRMVAALGGPEDFVSNYDAYLESAPVIRPVYGAGTIVEMNTRAVGNALIELGGGRHEVGEKLNLSVGFSEVAPIGAELSKDRPMAIVHAASEADADQATQNLQKACKTAAIAPAERPVIYEVITG